MENEIVDIYRGDTRYVAFNNMSVLKRHVNSTTYSSTSYYSPGIYFYDSENKHKSKDYGQYITKCFLKTKNIMRFSDIDSNVIYSIYMECFHKIKNKKQFIKDMLGVNYNRRNNNIETLFSRIFHDNLSVYTDDKRTMINSLITSFGIIKRDFINSMIDLGIKGLYVEDEGIYVIYDKSIISKSYTNIEKRMKWEVL